ATVARELDAPPGLLALRGHHAEGTASPGRASPPTYAVLAEHGVTYEVALKRSREGVAVTLRKPPGVV
ncbi:MAG: hypothetical protein ACREA0_19830, partial [bacterium]